MLLDSKILPVSAPEQNVKQIRNKKSGGFIPPLFSFIKRSGNQPGRSQALQDKQPKSGMQQ